MLHQSHISKRAPLLATYPSESDKVRPIPLHVCCACAYIMPIALQNGAVKVSYYGNVIFLLRFGFAVGWYLLITLLMVGSSPCCWMVFAHHPCCWMGFAHHPAVGWYLLIIPAVGWDLLITLLMVGHHPAALIVGSSPCSDGRFITLLLDGICSSPCCWMGFAHHPAVMVGHHPALMVGHHPADAAAPCSSHLPPFIIIIICCCCCCCCCFCCIC
jgi:hypothetical protein